MSSEIMRSIKIDKKNKEVVLVSASTNCWPRDYHEDNNVFYKNLWAEKGLEAVEKDILGGYLIGMMKGGSNRFSKAGEKAKRLFSKEYKLLHSFLENDLYKKWNDLYKKDPKMKKIKWYDSPYEKNERKESKELYQKKIDLNYKAMHTRVPAEKINCVIKTENNQYFESFKYGKAWLCDSIKQAKYMKESKAEEIIERFPSYNLTVLKV